jgi:hypothetical protein
MHASNPRFPELIGMLSNFAVLYGLLIGKPNSGWTALFIATTILISATGFPLPPFGFDQPRAVGLILLVLLAMAVVASYGKLRSRLMMPS